MIFQYETDLAQKVGFSFRDPRGRSNGKGTICRRFPGIIYHPQADIKCAAVQLIRNIDKLHHTNDVSRYSVMHSAIVEDIQQKIEVRTNKVRHTSSRIHEDVRRALGDRVISLKKDRHQFVKTIRVTADIGRDRFVWTDGPSRSEHVTNPGPGHTRWCRALRPG